MDAVARAWESLKESGFTKYDLVRSEFDSPLVLKKLFDTKLECMNLVSGLHGDGYRTNEVLADAAMLYDWSEGHSKLFSVLEREDRDRVKRFRLLSPGRVEASDVYAELLGMDAKLQSRVSKSFFRCQLKNPLASKSELENAAREAWLAELVGFLKEAELPICRILEGTSEPLTLIRRSFGSRRMKTLRNRARAWRKVREWLIAFKGRPFPFDVSDMLDFLLFLTQEGAPSSRINEVAAALSVLEDAGQVPEDVKISSCRLWKQAFKSRQSELEVGRTETKRAPPLSTAMLISLEIMVCDEDRPTYMRALAWVVLLCVWACMRIDDLLGLDPKRMTLGGRGLRGFLVRTKTTGPGKNVKEVPFYVARKISISGHDWLKVGHDIWESFGCLDRDYFVFVAGSDFSDPIQRFASTDRIASYVRLIFAELDQPFRPRFSKWQVKQGTRLVQGAGVMFWSGHSMRHYLPSVAAAINIGKDQRDYVGRWHVNFHKSADYVHTSRQIVVQVQQQVNRSLCEGDPGYDESELWDELSSFLKSRGEQAEVMVGRHRIFKDGTKGPFLGGLWPMLDELGLEGTRQVPEETPATSQVPAEPVDQVSDPPYFVSISRRSGFRRLRKNYCCGVMPWQCYKVEWVHEVKSNTADAHCKHCLKVCGKIETINDSSTSGTSSSTDDQFEAGERPLDDGWDKIDDSFQGL